MNLFFKRIQKSIEDIVFRKRMPMPKGMECSALELSDDELCWEAHEHIEKALYEAKGSYGSKVQYLPPQWRMINTLFALDCDVMNGGFHQFFTNAGGRFDSYLLSDVKALGFDKLTNICEEAWKKYAGMDYEDQWANRGRSWEYFTRGYQEGRFDKQDSAYFEQSLEVQPIFEILGSYIRKNWELYAIHSN